MSGRSHINASKLVRIGNVITTYSKYMYETSWQRYLYDVYEPVGTRK